MLNFDDEYYNGDDDSKIYNGTLSSIFNKNKRAFIRDLDNKNRSSSIFNEDIPLPAAPPSEDELLFNSKLTWLCTDDYDNVSTFIPTDNYADINDFPMLSIHITKKNQQQKKDDFICPKIRDGYNCTRKKCSETHPDKNEVKKIVSDMRSLKKRVVKNVLDIIKEPIPTTTTKSVSKIKLCKFLNNCKYKNKCKFAHSNDELVINNCRFDNSCKLIRFDDGKYTNNSNKGTCLFLHPHESRDMFFTRIDLNNK